MFKANQTPMIFAVSAVAVYTAISHPHDVSFDGRTRSPAATAPARGGMPDNGPHSPSRESAANSRATTQSTAGAQSSMVLPPWL